MKTRNHLIVSHCIVHHLVEVARIIVVHYSHLLHYMDETVDDSSNLDWCWFNGHDSNSKWYKIPSSCTLWEDLDFLGKFCTGSSTDFEDHSFLIISMLYHEDKK